jgi:RNA polymerase sigma factor (sigma-70 family)
MAKYIDKKEMLDELIVYSESGVITEKLGEMFLKIARRYTSKPKFSGYTYREDMISEAVERMVSQIHKFDVKHPSANPFCYFTQVAHNQILQLLKREKKKREIKYLFQKTFWEDFNSNEHLKEVHDDDEIYQMETDALEKEFKHAEDNDIVE